MAESSSYSIRARPVDINTRAHSGALDRSMETTRSSTTTYVQNTGDAGSTTTMHGRPSPSQAPPWEALQLVAPFLDAASLAAASCVSTSWHAAFAADHLWARLCRCHYPSAIGLLPLPDNDDSGDRHYYSPHRRVFALFHSASTRRCALPAPRLALADVTFAIDFFSAGGENTLSFTVSACDAGAKNACSGVFQFGVNLSDRNAVLGQGEHWSVRWTAVRTGLGIAPMAVVLMTAKVPAARAGALARGERGEAWATERLPAPGCGGGRLEAEVVVEVTGEERLVENVRFGVMLDCRYVSVDEGLRYLQHFLL